MRKVGGDAPGLQRKPLGDLEIPVLDAIAPQTLPPAARLAHAAIDFRKRVLSTELRRLVSEGRKLRICLGPGIFLYAGVLARLFFSI